MSEALTSPIAETYEQVEAHLDSIIDLIKKQVDVQHLDRTALMTGWINTATIANVLCASAAESLTHLTKLLESGDYKLSKTWRDEIMVVVMHLATVEAIETAVLTQ